MYWLSVKANVYASNLVPNPLFYETVSLTSINDDKIPEKSVFIARFFV